MLGLGPVVHVTYAADKVKTFATNDNALTILEGTPVKQDFVSCTFLVRNDSDASLRMTGFSESETVYQWRTQSTIEAVKNVSQALPQKRLKSTTELIFCLWATRLLIIMQRRFEKMVESISYRRSGFMG